MPKVSINVLTAEDARAGEVAERLRAAGMEVEHVLDDIGLVAGSAEPDQLAALRQVPGVQEIEESRAVGIDPPDAEIQ